MSVLFFIWQLPQHLLALILLAVAKRRTSRMVAVNARKTVKVYFTDAAFGCGASLGNYIILDRYYLYAEEGELREIVSHEYGHHIQSLLTGPLYLLVVGVPSAFFNNLYDRVMHGRWTAERRERWYYSRYPEKWADRLGKVKRNR